MVFNRKACELILQSVQGVEVISHDWWCYQIISGAGGTVIYDPEPCLKYRQHTENVVGSNHTWKARLKRIRGLFSGKFRDWNSINIAALFQSSRLLTAENRQCLEDFSAARKSGLMTRVRLFRRAGIYRQTLAGNLGLLAGIIFNKV